MRHILITVVLILLSGCNEDRELWFSSDLNLTAFLKERVAEVRTEITFQVCNASRQPLSHGLLRFDWEDNGGRMSFQTDGEGKITMKFDADILESDIQVSIDEKPRGQSFIEAGNYDASTKTVPDGHIRVTW